MSTDEKQQTRPDKTKKTKGSVNGRGPSVEWINPSPNDNDRKWLVGHEGELVSLVLTLIDDFSDTERLSLKRDDYSGRWMAIFFGDPNNGRNAGLALSVRGASPYHAIILLAYFHLVRFNREWEYVRTDPDSEWG